MGEPELYEPGDRKKAERRAILRRMTLANAIFIIVIVALAAISISLFGLVNHYYDSKYKAQYELVTTLSESISVAGYGILQMVDGDYADFERFAASVYSQTLIMQAQNAAHAIDVMYPRESKESDAFAAVGGAVRQMEDVVASYESQLYNAFQHNATYESNAIINALFENASFEMSALANLILAGIDHSRDSMESPYSLVKRMDLEAIVSASGQLEDTGVQLAHLLP